MLRKFVFGYMCFIRQIQLYLNNLQQSWQSYDAPRSHLTFNMHVSIILASERLLRLYCIWRRFLYIVIRGISWSAAPIMCKFFFCLITKLHLHCSRLIWHHTVSIYRSDVFMIHYHSESQVFNHVWLNVWLLFNYQFLEANHPGCSIFTKI